MFIIHKTRREFLRLSAGSLAGAALLSSLPASAASARFKSIDDALAQGVSNGTVAGVVALAADSRAVVYEGAYGVTQDTVFWLLSMTKAITAASGTIQ